MFQQVDGLNLTLGVCEVRHLSTINLLTFVNEKLFGYSGLVSVHVVIHGIFIVQADVPGLCYCGQPSTLLLHA